MINRERVCPSPSSKSSALKLFVARASAKVVLVRSPEQERLRSQLEAPGITVSSGDRGALEVHGLTAEQIGDTAAAHGIAIHELTPQQASLEEAFMSLTRSEIEFATLVDGEQPAGIAA